VQTAQSFIDRINAHDVAGLAALMTDDHVFLDGMGDSLQGRDAMREAWHAYFAMVPDYWIRAEHVLAAGDTVAVLGRAGGTYAPGGRLDPANRWEAPAAWQARIRGGRVALWQVHADNEPLRRILERVDHGGPPA
jgi:uncharacterized protein (TIGR02246 family)